MDTMRWREKKKWHRGTGLVCAGRGGDIETEISPPWEPCLSKGGGQRPGTRGSTGARLWRERWV